MRIFPTLLLLFIGCSGGKGPALPPLDPVAQPKPEETETSDGAAIFRASCASCHGEKGDGKGILVLDRPARSFVDGGFSFGNTHEAIFRTVTRGIIRTPMPGFAEALSDAQRHAVTDHVISLSPTLVEATAEETILVVRDRPLVVRGHLPSVAEGLPERPRGLLVGGLDDLTWEYRVDDVRLLAVRQGAFVNRTDWGGRGGTPLEPLGKVIHLNQGGDPVAPWRVQGMEEALIARLSGTSIRGRTASLRFRLLAHSGEAIAEVETWGQVALTDPGHPFRRHFRVTDLDPGAALLFENQRVPKPVAGTVEFSR